MVPYHRFGRPTSDPQKGGIQTLKHCGMPIAAAFAILLSVSGLGAQPSPTRVPWIDVHVHPIGGRGRSADFPIAVNAAAAVMAEAGIKTMVVMPPPQVRGARPSFDFESFIEPVKSHGTRMAFLGGGGSLNPMIQEADHQATIDDHLRKRFEERAMEILLAGAVGFGEITAHHLSLSANHPYESVPADHPLLLLLADIAGSKNAVIDFHFDVVVEDMKAPEWFSPRNPARFQANLTAFERLLMHNRNARIVWAHAGSDMLGQWTVSLSRTLLAKHPNLFMSLRVAPGRAPQNHPLTPNNQIKPEWRGLLYDFPERFVVGGDQFFVTDAVPSGPAKVFAQRAGIVRQRANLFLAALPEEVARKIGFENALRIYRLKE